MPIKPARRFFGLGLSRLARPAFDPLEDYRKILAFASSAIVPHAVGSPSERDALEVIRSICVARLHGDERAAAIVRHADRVRDALDAGASVADAEREAFRG